MAGKTSEGVKKAGSSSTSAKATGKAKQVDTSPVAGSSKKKATNNDVKAAKKVADSSARPAKDTAKGKAPQKTKGERTVLEIKDSSDEDGDLGRWEDDIEDNVLEAKGDKAGGKSLRGQALEVPSEDEEVIEIEEEEEVDDKDYVDEEPEEDEEVEEREEEEDVEEQEEHAQTNKRRGKLPERASHGRLTSLTSNQGDVSKAAVTGKAGGGKGKGVVRPNTDGYVARLLVVGLLTTLCSSSSVNKPHATQPLPRPKNDAAASKSTAERRHASQPNANSGTSVVDLPRRSFSQPTSAVLATFPSWLNDAIAYFRGLKFEDSNWISILDCFMQLEVALEFPNNLVRASTYLQHALS